MAIAYLGTNQIGSGGENNVIESISVNNVTQAVSNKNVNITVPSAPGTLNTTATAAQSTSSSEALSGNVTLHKVSKTGTYSDLIGTPNIPLAVYFDPSNQNLYFFKSTADRDSFVANKTQTSLVMFSTNTSPYIKFKDPNVLAALLANNIGDGIGVTEAQAAAVTDMSAVFTQNTDITTFDEFRYFTGLTTFTHANANLYRAFRGCTGLRQVTLPPVSFGALANRLFSECTSLERITFSSNKPLLNGNYVFIGCSNLTRIDVPSLSDWLAITDFDPQYPVNQSYCQRPFIASQNGHIYIDGVELTDVIIPNGVTTIRSATFAYVKGITSVSVSSTVEAINAYAFYGCTNLKTVTIPSSVTSIGAQAFFNCYALESITINEGVTTMGNSVFQFCTSLVNLTIPASLSFNTLSLVSGQNGAWCGAKTGTLRVLGNMTIGISGANEAWGFKKIIVGGDVTQNVSIYVARQMSSTYGEPCLEQIRIGGNYVNTVNKTDGISQVIYHIDRGRIIQFKFLEIMGTITTTSSGSLLYGNDTGMVDGFVLHLGYDAATNNALPCAVDLFSGAMSRISMIYVGPGTSQAGDQAVLNKYLADTGWAEYSSKLAIWYSYNGEFKNA